MLSPSSISWIFDDSMRLSGDLLFPAEYVGKLGSFVLGLSCSCVEGISSGSSVVEAEDFESRFVDLVDVDDFVLGPYDDFFEALDGILDECDFDAESYETTELWSTDATCHKL